MMKENRRLTKATDELCRQLDAWRKTRQPGKPIPSKLWDQAVVLATEQGLGRTARELRLDYTALSKRVAARTSGHPASLMPQFMELLAPLSCPIAECALEVESAGGARLRIEIKNVAASGLASIIREFAG